ncbi:MAG TPA: HNH endonuclease [Longimicrobiaceae bacterium]|nr:HNH endonuclease [Longimicrobiaceae bacterium]
MTLVLPKPVKREKARRAPIPRRRRPSPVRRTARAAQERELDALWSIRVRLHKSGAPRVCWACAFARATDAAHIIPRTYRRTRWVLANGLPLCRVCHQHFTAHPVEWEWRVQAGKGTDFYDALRRLSRTRGPVDMAAARKELGA